MQRITIIGIACLALSLAACSTTRKAVTPQQTLQPTQENELNKVAATYGSWKTFTTTGRITIGAGESFSSAMQMRMVNGKYVSISLRPILGIEVGKLYVSTDSIIVIDKYHKAYLAESLKRFTTAMPLSLSALQDLLLSRVFSITDGTLSERNAKSFSCEPDGAEVLRIKPRKQFTQFGYSFVLNKALQLTEISVSLPGSAENYAVNYGDYEPTLMGAVPGTISIKTQISKKDVSLGVEYNAGKVRWNNNFEDNIDINSSYRRITPAELPNLFKNF